MLKKIKLKAKLQEKMYTKNVPSIYNCVVNREVLANCNKYGVKVIDFFDYMPNEYNYMKERIENYII